jgi:hypothetical protein
MRHWNNLIVQSEAPMQLPNQMPTAMPRWINDHIYSIRVLRTWKLMLGAPSQPQASGGGLGSDQCQKESRGAVERRGREDVAVPIAPAVH